MEKRVRHVPYQGETLTLREVFFRCQERGFVVCEAYKRDLLVWLFDTKVPEGSFFYENQLAAMTQLQGVKGVPKLLQAIDLEDNIKSIIVEKTEHESLTSISSNTNKPPMIDHDLLTLGTCCLGIIERLHEMHIVANFINPDHIFMAKDGGFVCSNFTLCFDREQVEIKQKHMLTSTLFTNNNAKLQIRSFTQNLAQEDDFYNLGLLLYQMSYGNIDYKVDEGSGKLVVPTRPKRCFAIVNTIEKCLNPGMKSELKAEDLLREFENQLTFSQYPAAVESSEQKPLQIMANITLSELSSSKPSSDQKIRIIPKLGLFSSLGQSFIKATTDTEGWFISFIELSAESPDKDLLHKILEKAWRKRDKIRKLFEIIDKYLDQTAMLHNSLVASKCLIFMHLLLMKGPSETVTLPPPASRKKPVAGEQDKPSKACSFAHHLILRIKEVWETIAKGDLKDKQDTYRSQGFSYLIYLYSVVLVEKCKFGLDYVNTFSGNFSIEPLKQSQEVKSVFSCKSYADLDNYASGFLLFYNLLTEDIDVPGIQFSILEAVNAEIHNCLSVYCHFVAVYKKVSPCFEPRDRRVVDTISDTLENSLDHCIYRFQFLQEKIKNVPHFKIFSDLFPYVSTGAVGELKQVDVLTAPITEFDIDTYFVPNSTIGTFSVPQPYGEGGPQKEVSEQEKVLFIRRELEKDVKRRSNQTLRKSASSSENDNPRLRERMHPGLLVSEDPTRTQSPDRQTLQHLGAGRFSGLSHAANYYYNLEDEDNGIQKVSRSISPSPSPSPNQGNNRLVDIVDYQHKNFKLDESFKSLGKEHEAIEKPLLDKGDRRSKSNNQAYDLSSLEAKLAEGDPVVVEFLRKHALKQPANFDSNPQIKSLKLASGGASFQKKREVGVQTEILDQILFLEDSSSPKPQARSDQDLLNVKLQPESPTQAAIQKPSLSPQLTPREVLVSMPLPSKDGQVEKQLVSEVINKSAETFDLQVFIKEQVAKDVDDWIIKFDDLTFGKEVANGSTCTVYQGDYRGLPVGRSLSHPAIKKLKVDVDMQFMKEFKRELSVMLRIRPHPNLVNFIGVSNNSGELILVFEYCQGGTLFSLLHKQKSLKISNQQRKKVMIDVARGMRFLHENNTPVIHRDLKSLNLLFDIPIEGDQTNSFNIKIADFGLARAMDPHNFHMTSYMGTYVRVGLNQHWMAPEILNNETYTLKADVYSFAVVMWEILTRITPFAELKNSNAIVKYVAVDKGRPRMSDIPANTNKELIDLMVRCWDNDPDKRPTFAEILETLKKIEL